MEDVAEPWKQAVKSMWSLGDYRQMARVLEPCAEELALACEIGPELAVLDVAAGNGNFAVAAARRGARVVATDLTPQMVEWGQARSAAEGLDISWREADAEALPFEDGSFDLVGSTFGAMFAPRPDVVATELFRVAKPGGLVAMASWTTEGFAGRVSSLSSAFVSALVPMAVEVPSPLLWGDPEEVRRRFSGLSSSVRTDERTARFEFESFQAGRQFWERNNGPQIALNNMLPNERYRDFLEQSRRLIEELNLATDGRLVVESRYLVVRARKR
jgi:ubiquinone/menaquinone biosynthesis C-methylase UbiE